MPFRTRSLIRETATAFAVLALYVLVLLAPLHQAAGLQRDLDTLGYSSLDRWSVCVSDPQDEGEQPVAVSKCPVTGIGKHEVALATPPAIYVDLPRVAATVRYAVAMATSGFSRPLSQAQARAPPVMV